MIRVVLFLTWAVQYFRFSGRVGCLFDSTGLRQRFGWAIWSSVSTAGVRECALEPLTLGDHMRIIATRETLFDFL